MVNLTFLLMLGIIFIGYLLWSYIKTPTGPIDNKRRPFSFDEKASVIEKNVLKYRKKRCEKCGATENLSIDHIIPIDKGGHNGLDNLRLLCKGCNSRKGANRY